ncbi:putative calmodulin, partial [Schistosoma mansoni]|uniref:putative calmodulin n=1 Tax=Schistosoma mansoni TaxID=6183 RepID=UPI00022DCA84
YSCIGLLSTMLSITCSKRFYGYFMNVTFSLLLIKYPRCLNSEELMEVFNELDNNGDGVVSRQELTTCLVKAGRLFIQIDQDRSGEIDVNELKSLFDETGMTVSRTVLDEWIRENDIDGNGKLNFEEFYSFVSSNL